MLTLVATTVLAFQSCPEVMPERYSEWTAEQKVQIQRRCADLDEEPVWLGRLRNRSVPMELGTGAAIHARGYQLYVGLTLRLGFTLDERVFLAVDGRFVFTGDGHSQLGIVSVGVPVPLGQWLLRPYGAFGIGRAERTFGGAHTADIFGGLGAEILLPNRMLGLSVENGVTHPVIAYRLPPQEIRAAGHLTVTLTWYFA